MESISPGIADLGGTIIDKSAFKATPFGDYQDHAFRMLRENRIERFSQILKPDELSALANFLRTADGSAWWTAAR